MITLLSVLSLGGSLKAECPVYLDKERLEDEELFLNPYRLKLFSYHGKKSQDGWVAIPLQVNKLDDDGLPDLSPRDESNFARNYRLSFPQESFGEKASATAAAPCKYRKRVEITLDDGRRAYLFACRNLSEKGSPASNFRIDTKERVIEGTNYGYRYDKRNNMLFDDVWVNRTSAKTTVARNAELRMRGDLKNFFTLNFDADDVETKLSSHSDGAVAFTSILDFYLRVLFFKINLQLQTAVNFFTNAVHVPMVLHMPVDARKWLHPGSGMFYTWETSMDDVSYDQENTSMPIFSAERTTEGIAELSKEGLRFCPPGKNVCPFRVMMRVRDEAVSMEFQIPRALVEKGFFPQFAIDAVQAQKNLGWPKDKKSEAPWQKVAVYFESSGIERGEHLWDFWMNVHPAGSSLQARCPAPVQVQQVSSAIP